MASYAYTFTSGDTVTPTKLNNARTVSEIVNADIKSDAAIAGSKLADGAITNAKVDASAAIAGTKIAPAFGAQDITVSTANRSITNTGNFALSFGTNNTERMRIDASGNIGIGTADATVGGGAMVVNHGANNGFVINQSTSASPATLYFRNTVDSTPAKIMFMGASGLTFADQNGNERMRIDASGNVGIGTSSPSTRLHLLQSANAIATIETSDANSVAAVDIKSTQGTGRIIHGTGSTNNLAFTVNASERMRIDASGNVGIGTASPTQKLDVRTSGTNDIALFATLQELGGLIRFSDGNTTVNPRLGANTNSLVFHTNASGTATERMRIDASGNVGINDTAPAYHLDVNGDANVTGVWRVDDTQVVTNRRTGWAAPTGTATRTTFATSTVTTAQLAERVKALIDDLTTHGLIGA
jgi:hypothetical protein